MKEVIAVYNIHINVSTEQRYIRTWFFFIVLILFDFAVLDKTTSTVAYSMFDFRIFSTKFIVNDPYTEAFEMFRNYTSWIFMMYSE